MGNAGNVPGEVTEQQAEQEVVDSQRAAPVASSGEAAVRGMPGVPVFAAECVSIYYGSFRAVTDVSLSVHQHEITAFTGPSGCGKTTVPRTLNRMNDLVPGARVEGEVRYHGVPL